MTRTESRCYETGALRVPRGGAGRRPDRAGGRAGESATTAAPWVPEVEVTDGSAPVGELASAIGPDGTFVVAWAERFDGAVRVATRAPGAAGFSRLSRWRPLARDCLTSYWSSTARCDHSRVGARRDDRQQGRGGAPAAGSVEFGAPATVAESSRRIVDIVGVGDAAGRVTLAWLAWVPAGSDRSSRFSRPRGSRSPRDGPSPNPLTSTAGSPSWLRPGGRWRRSGDRGVGVAVVHPRWRSRPGPGPWQCRVRHGADPLRGRRVVGIYVDLASNAAGATVLGWALHEGSGNVLRVADRSPGAASFGDPVAVADVAPTRSLERRRLCSTAWATSPSRGRKPSRRVRACGWPPGGSAGALRRPSWWRRAQVRSLRYR